MSSPPSQPDPASSAPPNCVPNTAPNSALNSASNTAPFRTFDEAFAWLAASTNYETMAAQRYDERTYGLDRVRRLLARLGRPDQAYDVVQIVGSKGKGSTAATLASILVASGRRTGLYSSPHLVHPRERIRVDGVPAPDDVLRDALQHVRPHVEAMLAAGTPCTFFEIHTAAALVAFAAAGCDAVVLEAGMGGRLDATTAADALGVVLTTISLDHTEQLGTTLAAVAREKVAAARSDRPLLCGLTADGGGFAEIASRTVECGASLVHRGRDFEVNQVVTSRLDAERDGNTGTRFVLVRPGRAPEPLATPLRGAHQAQNAALAAVTADVVAWSGPPIDAQAIRSGVATTRLRARLDVIDTGLIDTGLIDTGLIDTGLINPGPLVLVDGAHSPASLAVLARALDDLAAPRPRVALFAMARDKDIAGSFAALAPAIDAIVGVSTGGRRAASPEEIAAAARSVGLGASGANSVAAGLDAAREQARAEGTVIVTGSLYLCGAVLGLRDSALGLRDSALELEDAAATFSEESGGTSDPGSAAPGAPTA